MAIAETALAGTTFEAFVLDAAVFSDHAKVTVFAHHPYDREMEITIPANLGGTNPAINWRGLEFEDHQGLGRFTLDDNNNVVGWAIEDFDYYHQG